MSGLGTISVQRVRIGWAGQGWLGEVRALVDTGPKVDIVAAARLSPGAIALLNDATIGWVDELGNAEIAFANVVVSRTGRVHGASDRPKGWTPAYLAVAEAVLSGESATVSSICAATGLSTGTCTNALRMMSDRGFLTAAWSRGRAAGRQMNDGRALLAAYAAAANSVDPPTGIKVGVSWRDAIEGVRTTFEPLTSRGVGWAATGAVAAALDAPLLTNVNSAVVYVDAETVASLDALGRSMGLKQIDGGRLELRSFPIGWTNRSLRVLVPGVFGAPWPRVYVDLRTLGVRGEEAAEHLADQYLG